MIEKAYRFFHESLWAYHALFLGSPDTLCQVETAYDENTLALSGGDLISVLEVSGALRLMDTAAVGNISVQFAEQFSSSLSRQGHFLQFVFTRDPSRGRSVVREALAMSRLTADRIRIDMEDFFQSQEDTLSKYVSYEKAWIVIGTTRRVLNPAEVKQNKKMTKTSPLGLGSVRLSSGSQLLLPKHETLVKSIQGILSSRDIVNHQLTANEVLAVNRKMIDPEFTAEDWKPRLPGTRFPVRFADPGQMSRDFSHILFPSPGRQMFPRNAQVKSMRTVEIGEWIHAPIFVSIPPENPSPFLRLFNTLLPSGIPWRGAFLVTGDALSTMGLKSVLAAFLAWTNSDNKLISDGLKNLKEFASSGRAVVGWQAVFDTWAPKNDTDLLAKRLSSLAQAVQAWGNCDTSDQTGDPLAGVVSSLPGYAPLRSPAPKAAAPIDDAIFMAPIYRPTLPWTAGSCLLRSPDGRLMFYQPGSSVQPAWVEIGVGPMGYGKSAFLSVSNLSLALSPGRDTLPWIMTVDRGPSSSGLVNLVKSRLPNTPEYQRMAAFYRLQNTADFAVNPLDTPLGCREPLPVHRSFLQNLFTILATPVSGETLDGVPGLMQMAIDRTYKDMAPYEEGGIRPRRYEVGIMPEIDEAIAEKKIAIDGQTTWWQLEDFFFDEGDVMRAMLCHRRAVPRIADVASTIQDPTVSSVYREGTTKDIENLPAFAWRSLVESINQYPLLAETTRFDIGDARIVAFDLEEVTSGSGPVADRQAVVMYMMARHVLGARLFLMPDHVPLIHPKYQEFHAKRIAEIRRDPKKLSFDEFHKVSTNPILVEQFQRDLETTIRESRKWNLHVGLYSQKIDDFPDSILDHATTILVFGVGTEGEGDRTASRMKMDPAIARVLPRITKPTAEGANMVAAFRTDKGFVQQLLTNTLGPVALWSFSTVAEETSIKNALFPILGVKESIRRLVEWYPGGIKKEVEKRQALKGEESGDVIMEIIRELIEFDEGKNKK